MARYSIHEEIRVGELNHAQLTSLTAFLSSPATSPRPPITNLAPPLFRSLASTLPPTPPSQLASSSGSKTSRRPVGQMVEDLADLKIESDLRREILENIGHQRSVGSYVGRRHAMGLPVRGQTTRSNAKTARKLNRVDRRS
jgi:small subunit ribosomal protein S13